MCPSWIESSRFCPNIVSLSLASPSSTDSSKRVATRARHFLSVSSFHLTSRFYAEAVFFPALYTPPSTYACSSYLPAYSALLLPHLLEHLLLARPPLCHSLSSEMHSLLRCSVYTPLPCLIQHASAHCICSTLSPDAATLSHIFCVCLSQLYLLLLSSLSHAILALQVIIESHDVRCTAVQTRRRSSS
jgi:hypothetical protein